MGSVGYTVKRSQAGSQRPGSLVVGDRFGANEITPRISAEMRGINPAKNAVPVGVVALGAQEQIACFHQIAGGFRVTASRRNSGDARGNSQHFLVEQVGFGIFAKEAAPGAATKKGENFRAGTEFLQDLVIALADSRGEHPLHHFRVGRGWKISADERQVRRQIFAGGGNLQPVRVVLKRVKEIREPAVLVTVFMRTGPDTELFHVIAHGSHAVRMEAGGIAKIRDHVCDFAKGNEIAQGFLPGIEADALAKIFSHVSAKKLVRLEAGGQEVNIIDQRVSDVCSRQRGRKLRLPDALGQPGAGGGMAEMLLKIDGPTRALLALIFRRTRDPDVFVEAATDKLNPAGLNQIAQAREIFGPMLLDPNEERTGIVEAEVHAGTFFELFDAREITSLVSSFQDVLEIAARLAGVNG